VSIIRFRHRPGDVRIPTQTRGHLGLELLWTAIPAVIVLGLFAGTVAVLLRVESMEEEPGVEILVTGFRWGWTFEYPEDGVSVSGIGIPGPEMVVPVDEPIRVTLQSADVQHAFAVPEFLFKRDVYPGHINVIQFTVETPGSYGGQCAEFCGLYHSRMPFVLTAVSRDEFDAWVADRLAAGEAP
jgi:cytochrome c oxidase subunit 2